MNARSAWHSKNQSGGFLSGGWPIWRTEPVEPVFSDLLGALSISDSPERLYSDSPK
jgi:hypothetical protein